MIIDDRSEFQIEEQGEELLVNGEAVRPDMVRLSQDSFHLIYKQGSYMIELLDIAEDKKSGRLRVNGKQHLFSLRDNFDELLEKMGMAGTAAQQLNELRAPMPGLVLKVLVTPGQQVGKGDPLLVLEAMKMENVIKAAGEGEVKEIKVNPGHSVEKNELLIRFSG